jgi:inner membrane transporter RhtA
MRYFAVSSVFHYLGPSFAVLLFSRVDVLGVAWLRIVTAAVVFAVWRRPWRRRPTPTVLAWAAVLAAMNCCFYEAISRLPLGTVAAIEFVPIVVLAALGTRTRRGVQALALAVAGVALLAQVSLHGEPLGFLLAAVNAGLFAAYIVLADHVSGDGGLDALALAMLIAAVLVTPFADIPDATALAAGAGVGISSSVIPYVTDQLALRELSRATYALCTSLLPALATVIGLVVLAQVPTPREAAGVALVAAGVAISRGSASRRRREPPPSRPPTGSDGRARSAQPPGSRPRARAR